MKIVEKKPDGRNSVKAVRKWFGAIDKNMSDPQPFYDAIIPGIKQALLYTFSDANPSQWPMTTQAWRDRKAKLGYPTTVGYMTGALSRAWGKTPDISTTKKRLLYTFDRSESGYKGKSVTEYVIEFNRFRNILGYTVGWLNKRVKAVAIKSWLAINKRVEK